MQKRLNSQLIPTEYNVAKITAWHSKYKNILHTQILGKIIPESVFNQDVIGFVRPVECFFLDFKVERESRLQDSILAMHIYNKSMQH